MIKPFSITPLFLSLIAISMGTVVHAAPVTITTNASSALIYPEIDHDLGERLYPNEASIAKEVADIIELSIRKEYATGIARRDAHPKAHGCVRAEFKIDEKLPKNLVHGVFQPGKTYQAWIRFSNASSNAQQADIKKDARGMAIKVLIPPDANLPNQKTTSQDFIMINHPVFFVNDPARYVSFMQDVNSDGILKKLHIPFALGLKGTRNALNSRNIISSPLQTRYWSMVPYQLGIGAERQVVKYSAKSCSSVIETIPKHPHHNYLRENLQSQLLKQEACMAFFVQARTSNTMSIEDSMTEWNESKAPFYKVATIHIPQQIFDTSKQNMFCENLSFTPWHTLPEHKPLGAINRMRKVIYERISQVRHEMNATERFEPH